VVLAAVGFVYIPQGYTEMKHCILLWEQEVLVRNAISTYESHQSLLEQRHKLTSDIETLLYHESITKEDMEKLQVEVEGLKSEIHYLSDAPSKLKDVFEALTKIKTEELTKKTADWQFLADSWNQLKVDLAKKNASEEELTEKLNVSQKEVCNVLQGLDEESKRMSNLSGAIEFLNAYCHQPVLDIIVTKDILPEITVEQQHQEVQQQQQEEQQQLKQQEEQQQQQLKQQEEQQQQHQEQQQEEEQEEQDQKEQTEEVSQLTQEEEEISDVRSDNADKVENVPLDQPTDDIPNLVVDEL